MHTLTNWCSDSIEQLVDTTKKLINMEPVALRINTNCTIGDGHPTFIIAEIGQNHQGDINIAKELIKVAKDSGVNCVKFQKTCLEEKFNKAALNRPYTSINSWGKTYGEHKQCLEFSSEQFLELQTFAKEIDIMFTASAMDITSLNFLESIQVPFIKIGSGDSNNLIMIKEAASKHIPLIVSTGMQDLVGVKNIYKTISQFHKNFALLHCVSAYPTPIEDVNLKVLELFKNEFPDIPIGYSGHELGSHITLSAVALGAKIIERHITLDKAMKGSDHKCSLIPPELKSLVRDIRSLEIAMGRPVKQFQKSEEDCYNKLGKSLVAAKGLKAGQVLTPKDLKTKVAEPKGLDASLMDLVIGKTLKEDVSEDESITKKHCM